MLCRQLETATETAASILTALRMAALATAALAAAVGLSGCGTPGAPQPPSLKVPGLVDDLSAVRAGDSVTLTWTNPRKTTDRLLIKDQVTARICRRESGACVPAGTTATEAGKPGSFHETLPPELTAGKARRLDYFVELMSPKGKSAGLSDAAPVMAGSAPGALAGLSMEVRQDGVALHWNASETAGVRLRRRLISPPKPKAEAKPGKGLMQAPRESPLSDMFVEHPATAGGQQGALDATAHFGEVYEYSAQYVVQVHVNGSGSNKAGAGSTLELAGPFSALIRVDVLDTFPPAVPEGLVAVADAADKTIDLSWQPDTDADLAGYIVYRAEGDGSDWKRISGAQPLTASAYRDTAAEPGHAYRYRVSAIDQTGHESKPSAEAQETDPQS